MQQHNVERSSSSQATSVGAVLQCGSSIENQTLNSNAAETVINSCSNNPVWVVPGPSDNIPVSVNPVSAEPNMNGNMINISNLSSIPVSSMMTLNPNPVSALLNVNSIPMGAFPNLRGSFNNIGVRPRLPLNFHGVSHMPNNNVVYLPSGNTRPSVSVNRAVPNGSSLFVNPVLSPGQASYAAAVQQQIRNQMSFSNLPQFINCFPMQPNSLPKNV
jgi:hypothetical protein